MSVAASAWSNLTASLMLVGFVHSKAFIFNSLECGGRAPLCYACRFRLAMFLESQWPPGNKAVPGHRTPKSTLRSHQNFVRRNRQFPHAHAASIEHSVDYSTERRDD